MGHRRGAETTPTDGPLWYRARARVRKTGHGCLRIVAGIGLVIALGLEDGVFAHAFSNRLLELRGLEQRRAIRYTGDCLVCLEDPPCHAHVNFFASLEVKAKPAQHDCDQTARAGTGNQIKMVARLGYLVATRWFAFAFDVCPIHEFLKDDKHGVTADTSSICLIVSSDFGCIGERIALT